jgi:PAS domain S-box-containing protein
MKSIRKILFIWFALCFTIVFAIVWAFLKFEYDFNESIIQSHNLLAELVLFAAISVTAIFCISSFSKLIIKPFEDFIAYMKLAREGNWFPTEHSKSAKEHKNFREVYTELYQLFEIIKAKDEALIEVERKLKIVESNQAELTEILPQSIFETDESGKLVYVNKKFLETFGYEMSEIREKELSILDIIITDSIENIFNETAFFEADLLCVCKGGTLIPVSLYSSNVDQDNKIKGIRGIITNNSERMKYVIELQEAKTRAEEMNNLKTIFLANISNEIRPSMNAILGYSNLLAISDKSNKIKEDYVYEIISCGEHLLKIIDDVIDLAKIEAGELNINESHFDLNALITDIFSYFIQLRNSKKKTNIEFRLQPDFSNKPFIIKSDPLRLRQILNKLISNSLQYTQKGYIEFGYSDFGSVLQFYVRDTGIGIPKKSQNLIFDRNYNIEQSESKLFGGKGIGLAITKSLVKLLGGRIWLNSEPGIGSTFYFTIQNEKIRTIEYSDNKVLEQKVDIN